jgi:hypothetical protein
MLFKAGSGDSSVAIVKGYVFNGQSSILGRSKISLFSTDSSLVLGPNHPPIQWVLGTISPGVKLLGNEADHSPPPSVEVKIGGVIPPLPIYLHSKVLN